jgi:hypothetical protein
VILLAAERAGLVKILAGVAGGIVAATNSALVVVGRTADWDETEAGFLIGIVAGVLVVTLAVDGEAAGVVGGGAADERLTLAPAETFAFVGEDFVLEGKLEE